MSSTITARHFDLTDRIRLHADESISRLAKFFNNIISSDLSLTLEKNRYTAELKLSVYHEVIHAKAESHELFLAIDQCSGKAERQLKRYKSKLKDKDPEAVAELSATNSRPRTDVEEIDV
ncbi:MAG: ribosome hibernation-promoting factor, HPF/YfiA family [Candidatus Zixiibacteriota bacterium]